jgi:hypothetical protein
MAPHLAPTDSDAASWPGIGAVTLEGVACVSRFGAWPRPAGAGIDAQKPHWQRRQPALQWGRLSDIKFAYMNYRPGHSWELPNAATAPSAPTAGRRRRQRLTNG